MFNVVLKTGEVFVVTIKQAEHEREANGFPKETTFTLLDKYPNGKQKKREGFLRTTAIVENVHEPQAERWIGELVYDIEDFVMNGGKLTPEIKELGRRKALLKALHSKTLSGFFDRAEIKDFMATFEDHEREQRARNFLPQVEAKISRLLDEYGRAGGDVRFLSVLIFVGQV